MYEIMEAYTCLVSREVDGSGGAKVPASALCPVASARGGAQKGPHGLRVCTGGRAAARGEGAARG